MTFSRLSLLFSILIAPALAGCGLAGMGAILGNVFVVFLTVGIFFGTLGLGRGSSASSSTASRTDRPDRPAQD
jgi:hypothetical protein